MVHFLEHVGWPYGQWACLCHVCGVLGCMLWAFWPVGGHVRQVSWKGCMLWKASVVEGLHVVECVGGPVRQLFGADNYLYILAHKSNYFFVHEA